MIWAWLVGVAIVLELVFKKLEPIQGAHPFSLDLCRHISTDLAHAHKLFGSGARAT